MDEDDVYAGLGILSVGIEGQWTDDVALLYANDLIGLEDGTSYLGACHRLVSEWRYRRRPLIAEIRDAYFAEVERFAPPPIVEPYAAIDPERGKAIARAFALREGASEAFVDSVLSKVGTEVREPRVDPMHMGPTGREVMRRRQAEAEGTATGPEAD